jgi:PAS domain-containing protein
MGSSVSVVATKLDAVDPSLYELCDDIVMTGSELFIDNANARQAFIKKGIWKEKLGPQHSILDDTFDTIKDLPTNLYSSFVFSSSPSELSMRQFLSSNCGSDCDVILQSFILEESLQKMKYILLAAIFPLFLESSDYSDYLEAEEKKTDLLLMLTSKFSPEKQYNKCSKSDPRLNRIVDLFSSNHSTSSSESLKTVVTEASESIDEEEMHFMLQHSYGLANVFASVENLHYCVSLATARRDRPGFPLVYVNKAFEAATGYKREEIIGRNCSFLQSESTEQDQINLVSKALAVKVVLTIKRNDGAGPTMHIIFNT